MYLLLQTHNPTTLDMLPAVAAATKSAQYRGLSLVDCITMSASRQRATPLDTTSSGVGSFSDSPDSGPPSVPPSREAESVQI
jgi:hypothetical protein